MSFDNQRDMLRHLERIEHLVRELVAVLREAHGLPAPPKKGWDPAHAAQVAWEMRALARAVNRRAAREEPAEPGYENHLPASGGIPVDEFFSRPEP